MLHVFIGEILAVMTQVSDVAPWPLVLSVLKLIYTNAICPKIMHEFSRKVHTEDKTFMHNIKAGFFLFWY
jgi:hypothetical protein